MVYVMMFNYPTRMCGHFVLAGVLMAGALTCVAELQRDQSGKAQQVAAERPGAEINDVRLVASQDALDMLTAGKTELHAWRTADSTGQSGWKLTKEWVDFVYLWYGVAAKNYVIVVLKNDAQLFRVGLWDKPLLMNGDSLPKEIISVTGIYPVHDRDPWWGFAVQERGDPEQDGHPNKWKLFFTLNGANFAELRLSGGPSAIKNFLRLGPGQIAVET